MFFMKTKIKRITLAALMTALCVIIGLICKRLLTFGAIRVTFENIPVLLAGILLGPVYGAAVGAAADLISAPLSGFAPSPVITVGAASIGLTAGLFSQSIAKSKRFAWVFFSVMSAHFVGSVVIKTVGLYLMRIYAWQFLAMRIPLYLLIGIAESYIIYILLKHKIFKEALK